MMRSSAAVVLGGFLMSAGGATLLAQTPQTTPTQTDQQKQTGQQSVQKSQVTLTGCLRQTSDDPNVFALVSSQEKTGTTGTTGTKETASHDMTKFPLYRLDDTGQQLKSHTGQRIEVTGTVTPAKDEKGVDIIASRSENIGVPTTTITTVDLKPAPRLAVTSVREVVGDCTAMPSESTAGTSGTVAGATPMAVSIGDVSEHPEKYIGKTVKLTGEVERVFNPRVFSLDEDRVLSTGVDVLVLARNPGLAKDNQRVTVTGVVRRFVRAEFEKEIIDLDLNPEWLIDFESRPVVIATEVTGAK